MQSTGDVLAYLLYSRRARLWVAIVCGVLLAVASFRSSVIDVNLVPSGSMEPTIASGSHIVVNKLAYDLKLPFVDWQLVRWSEPTRGSIVVFISPRDGLHLVKRVVAVGGDTVEMENNTLIVNGVSCQYRIVSGSEWIEMQAGNARHILADRTAISPRSFGPIVVPAGTFFMMGDHRDRIIDSRDFGAVQRNAILGRVLGR